MWEFEGWELSLCVLIIEFAVAQRVQERRMDCCSWTLIKVMVEEGRVLGGVSDKES